MKSSLTRRSFLKTTALAGAVAAVGLSAEAALGETSQAYADSEPERRTVYTCCHSCIQVCPCIAYVEDDVVVRLEGDPRAPISKGGMCLKGMTQLHTLYGPRHLLHPMKLVGQRGSNEWEQISWDDALDLAIDQLATSIEKYGKYSTWGGTGGGGTYVSSLCSAWPFAFGATIQVSAGALQCYAPRTSTSLIVYGGKCTSIADHDNLEMFNDYNPTMEVLVLWGAQPSVSQTAESGRGLADARVDRGLKTIVIDPKFTPDAAKADVWLPVRPGSDTALELAWIRYLIDNEYYDEDFCKYWTNLPFLINPDTRLPYLAEEVWPDYVNPAKDPENVYDNPAFVCFDAITNSIQPFPYCAPEDSKVDPVLMTSATVNGVESKTAMQIYWEEAEPWTLEKAAETCWIPDVDKIEEAIKLYATAEHAGICHGVFSDMQRTSYIAPLGTLMMDIMMGHVNTPGSCLTQKGPSSRSETRLIGPPGNANTYRNQVGAYGLGYTLGWTEAENIKQQKAAIAAWDKQGIDGQAMHEYVAQEWLDFLGYDEYKLGCMWGQVPNMRVRNVVETGEPYPVRVMMYFSGNWLSNIGNAGAWAECLRGQDFVMHQYANMTSFDIENGDLFFPTNEWLEYESATDHVVQMNTTFYRQQAVHLGETVNPFQVVPVMFDRLLEKYGEEYVGDKTKYSKTNGFTSLEKQREKWATAFKADSYEDLMENFADYNPIVVPPEKYWQYYQHEDIADDGLPVGFGTYSRKCEPYCAFVIRLGETGFPAFWPYEKEAASYPYTPICTHVEPYESPLDDTEYPLVLTSGRVPYYHHGTLRNAAFNRELYPVPEAELSPETAEKYGVEDGEWITITSRRGSTSGVAKVTKGITLDTIWMERFWFPECFDASQDSITSGFREANCAVLTYDDKGAEVMGSNTYRAFQVKIEKGKKPDRIWVEPKEFEPFMPTLKGEPQTGEVFM